ncbi:MAG TPA: hypothetical protein VFC92_01910 [Bacteroidales bacterium]|nr:hypothetical protein [Bacteroidales bacterium]
MKRISFFKFSRLLVVAMLVFGMTAIFSSCKDDKDDPKPDPEIVLDGTYVVGEATALPDFDKKGMMKITRNEVVQEERDGLMELYVAVKAGAAGFNIIKVEGATRTTYGPSANFAKVDQGTVDEPKIPFWRGSLEATDTKFTVPADGLYHVAIDMGTMKVVVVPVEYWGLIGAATPGGWGDDTQIPPQAFDLNSMTFELTNVTMTKGDFKFRYSGGWKVELDTTLDVGNGNVGVKINTNYGGAVSALVPGGDNIANDAPGYYTAKMVWKLGEGYTASITKTGDLSITDYSATELGLVGDGLMVGGVQHNWDETVMLQTPAVENETNYTWTFDGVEITTLGSFKFREGQDWNGKSIGFNDVTMAGGAAAKFETNADGNFVPLEDGLYDIVLLIEAETETYTVTVNEAGAVPMIWVPGDYQGWAPADAPTLSDANEDGVFVGTVEFPDTAPSFTFKFTSQPNWDGTNYGAGANPGELSTDGGAGNLEVPAAGTYLLTVDVNNLTWTYELQ